MLPLDYRGPPCRTEDGKNSRHCLENWGGGLTTGNLQTVSEGSNSPEINLSLRSPIP